MRKVILSLLAVLMLMSCAQKYYDQNGNELSKEQMELVNQFHTHIIDVHCMELEAQFQYGFSLEMMLMKEVYELLKHHHNSD